LKKNTLIPTLNKYFSLIKFSHTIFALPFAIIGFSLAIHSGEVNFNLQKFILVIMCMVFARSAAMAFNRYIDRKFDAKNPRTVVREIPSGQISTNAAILFVILCCVAFMTSSYFINPLCFYLSPVALIIVLGYSYTKRFTALCHLVLGLGLALAPIGAYIALTEKFATLPILFSILVFLWTSGFDIIYALQDDDFDKFEKLNSIPVLFGRKNALRISQLLHGMCALILISIYFYGDFGWPYIIGASTFVGLLIYQQTLVKPNDLSKVTLAFGTTNGIGSVIFCVFVCGDIFLF
jgi:4-hydroxybenzoate polyprenyltransferase